MEHNEATIDLIPFERLEFKGWLTIAWAMFWRGALIMIASFVCGAVIGGILGFIVGAICAAVNYPFESIRIPFTIGSFLLGAVIGFLFLILQLKWFFKTKFKNFRIALINTEQAVAGYPPQGVGSPEP